ncbi:MAG: ferrous iron transport protein A [Gemmatimonadetes bacterium]|nr:ferrous iron transport protein A [Gemmatimonadota bacterium]
MKLSETKVDEKVEIIEVEEGSEYQAKLAAMGFVQGCEVCPLHKNNNTMLVQLKGCRYGLGKEAAECILVKRL